MKQIIDFRLKHINKALSISHKDDPIYISKAKGVFIYDQNNNKFLDCINNVTHIGHTNKIYAKRMNKQLHTLVTNSRFLYDPMITATQKLLRMFPPHLQRVTWTNSGSESNDLAMQMAKTFTHKNMMYCHAGAYHGVSTETMSVSPYKWNQNCPQPSLTGVVQTACTYRGKYNDKNDSSQLYAKDFAEQLKNNNNFAGFITEAMQSCGGQVIPKQDYLQEIQKVVRANKGVFILDEVQTGFSRLGSHDFAFQYYDVQPDIVTIGKAMGNGFPVSAVICSEEIAHAYANLDIEYFSTCGGNPLACVATEAVIDVIQEFELKKNALEVGKYLLNKLSPLKTFPFVGDVRGLGLFLGIEFVENKQNKIPFTKIAKAIQILAKKRGVLLSVDGVHCNVIKIKPPMFFSTKNADTVFKTLQEILSKISKLSKEEINLL